MLRLIRAAACSALAAALAACASFSPSVPPPPVVWPPKQRPAPVAPRPVAPTPRPAAPVAPSQPAPAPQPSPGRERLLAVEQHIDQLHRRIDARVASGGYPAPAGDALHHRLDVIHQEASDISDQHGGSLSPDEQRLLEEELDTVNHAIEP